MSGSDPVSAERYSEIAFNCEDQELYHIWHDLAEDIVDYAPRRDALLFIVKRLLEDGLIKLVNMRSHQPLEGSIEQQVEQLRVAFPQDESDLDDGLWFYSEACPAGSAWQH